MDKVFISYKHDDYDEVMKYCDILDELKIEYFIDEEGINGGNFASELMEELRNCTVFVVFISRKSIISPWVFNEVTTAFQILETKGKPIFLPVFLEKMNDLTSYDMSFYLNSMNRINYDDNRYNNFKKKILNICKPIEKTEKKIKNTYYSLDDEKEVKRLEIQQNLIFSYDLPIYERITKNKENLALLDIGSGTGLSIMNRINKLNEKGNIISKLIGLEYDNASVLQANEKYNSNKYKFFHLDVEKENFSEELRKICSDENIDKFDIINISLVLLHLYNPLSLLVKLRRFLKPNGVFL